MNESGQNSEQANQPTKPLWLPTHISGPAEQAPTPPQAPAPKPAAATPPPPAPRPVVTPLPPAPRPITPPPTLPNTAPPAAPPINQAVNYGGWPTPPAAKPKRSFAKIAGFSFLFFLIIAGFLVIGGLSIALLGNPTGAEIDSARTETETTSPDSTESDQPDSEVTPPVPDVEPEEEDEDNSEVEGDAETDDDVLVTPDPAFLTAEMLAQSVVQLQLLLGDEVVCTGSGTIVDSDGTILTNFHVVEQSAFCPHDRIGVAVSQGSSSFPALRYEADLLTFDAELDLAVVRIARSLDGAPSDGEFVPVEIGNSDEVELGEEIQVIGFPGIGGGTVTFTSGAVSGFADTADGDQRSWIKTDATIAGGNSGGLAADSEGRFIGIPTQAGSGDSQIVDCRVIADSNGDGVLDGADTCVPIGGFINGLRPVALALPLIEAARTATPIDQGPPADNEPMDVTDFLLVDNPVWTSGVDDDGIPVDELFAGVVGMPQACFTWNFQDAQPGSVSEVNWLFNRESLDVGQTDTIDNVDGGRSTCISNSDTGLEAGVFEMEWIVNGELVFAEALLVGGGETAEVEVYNDSLVPLCAVQFNPNGTSTYGLNELERPIEPGESAFFTVHIGALDTLILDCNGEARIEDPSGFDVTTDIIVTVD